MAEPFWEPLSPFLPFLHGVSPPHSLWIYLASCPCPSFPFAQVGIHPFFLFVSTSPCPDF